MKRTLLAAASWFMANAAHAVSPTSPDCPQDGPLFIIAEARPDAAGLERFIEGLGTQSALVVLGPDTEIELSSLPDERLPVQIARCVRLTSVADLGDLRRAQVAAPPSDIVDREPARTPPRRRTRVGVEANLPGRDAVAADAAPDRTPVTTMQWRASWADRLVEARGPHRPGPIVRSGPAREDYHGALLSVECRWQARDHVRVSGFRLFGPSFDQQETGEAGLQIHRCLDVEVTNMEVAGWGGNGVRITDEPGEDRPNYFDREGQPREHWGRITAPEQVRIHGNYIHHNQNPQSGGGAAGYGVFVGGGAWARIYENTFDVNRHAIAATHDVGGYVAERNLVLKGGGYHGAWYSERTHQFDVHGSGCRWSDDMCGNAGQSMLVRQNAFQYILAPAIELRGLPSVGATIENNVFEHGRLSNTYGIPGPIDASLNPAISLNTDENVTVRTNATEVYSFGQYGVCDFDGDRIDDLFLPTGVTWWYSSGGENPWIYLNLRTERLGQVRLGYFDDDNRCDVLVEEGGRWKIASGGVGALRDIGASGAPLGQTWFGRFDPLLRDHRSGVTQRTTHAFWRTPSGEWKTKRLFTNEGWLRVQHSNLSFDSLRFGDFENDGLTNVFAVVEGHWQTWQAGWEGWRPLNERLSDSVDELVFADINNNGRDDVLRLEGEWRPPEGRGPTGAPRPERPMSPVVWTGAFTWWISDDGAGPWRRLTSYTWRTPATAHRPMPPPAFAGRFGAAPGDGVLLVDAERIGHFHAPLEASRSAPVDWESAFAY